MSAPLDLNTIWFILVGLLFTGYAVLDGFDLGVGALHLFARRESDRRFFLRAIAPVWDGNEVWLVAGGGALFAAFPEVYATIFSGFYLAMMAFVFCLIFRAAAIEFRNQLPHPAWQRTWDIGFGLASLLASIILGIALANLLRGVPLDADFEYAGSTLTLFNGFALLAGFATAALMMMHGALFLALKSTAELAARMRLWAGRAGLTFGILLGLALLAGPTTILEAIDRLNRTPLLYLIPSAAALAFGFITFHARREHDSAAFLGSCAFIILLMIIVGAGLYPAMVRSNPNPQFSLTIYNAASSQKTLGIMLRIAMAGLPLVIIYTIVVYRVFRGKAPANGGGY